jgi:uncharacterized damage-inducible protein DinB
MVNTPLPEVWLRGPISGIPALLQPVAHSLQQCREEMVSKISDLTSAQIWATPGGGASVGFHVRHATGSLDRLFTYARGEQLSPAQRAFLAAETQRDLAPQVAVRLVAAFEEIVERALEQLKHTDESALLDARGVGRAQLPSTVLGLLFHAAEHTQRHLGQIATTVRVVSASETRG